MHMCTLTHTLVCSIPHTSNLTAFLLFHSGLAAEDAARISEQLEKMKSEKNVLNDKLQKEHALLTQISQEKAALESEREILDEREFNLALKEVFGIIYTCA